MIIIRQPVTLRQFLDHHSTNNRSIGFVPTMGALHEGHLELVRRSAEQNDLTVCSIFVNPAQFNDAADFNKYPNRIPADIKMLSGSEADILFLPDVKAVYPGGTDELELYDLGYLETILEGHYRPGHFQGVCQVMKRLLDVVRPQKLFMGQKDYQQCMVVQKLLTYLDFPVNLITVPTLREPDGLAMSSRNLRLTPRERQIAPAISETLLSIRDALAPGSLAKLKENAQNRLQQAGFKVDYVEIANTADLQPSNNWNGTTPLVALIAAFLGEVRLIDNLLLDR